MLVSDRPADLETWQRTGMILDTPGDANVGRHADAQVTEAFVS